MYPRRRVRRIPLQIGGEMSETMEDYREELNESLKKLDEADVVSGKVENEEQAETTMAWARLKEMKDNKETIQVKVGGMVNGGLIAYVENMRGFIPASQLSLEYVENLDEWLGKVLDVRVITVDPARKKLVLSAKAILKEAAEKEKEAMMASLPGTVREGTVETIQPYGAFVNIGNGMTGLLHVSQISEKRIKTPDEVLKVGQEVTVKVLKTENGKISLSMKALNDKTADAGKSYEPAEPEYKLPKTKAVTTSLGDLLKGIKLD